MLCWQNVSEKGFWISEKTNLLFVFLKKYCFFLILLIEISTIILRSKWNKEILTNILSN